MTGAPPDRKAFGPLDVSLVLAALGAWAVARPYAGLVHDARLYMLQALSRLHPDSLGQDVFLRYGSQDAYSIFGGVYAAFIAALGPEDAARWLTLAGHLWWFAAAGWLAVQLLGRTRGLLALAIIAGLPGYYGAWEVFRYAEPFLTARLYAEAAVLTAIGLLVSGRRLASLVAIGLSMAIHPLMGAAGLLFCAAFLMPCRQRRLLGAVVLAGTAAAIALAHAMPMHALQVFDQVWLDSVRLRSPFLFLADWSADSFRLTLLPLLALWALSPQDAVLKDDRPFRSALLVGILGLVVTFAGADLARIVLLTQGQAWRWTWISAVLVVVALVKYAPGRWRRDSIGRAGLLLFVAAWILTGWPAVGVAAAGALLMRYGRFLPNPAQRFAFLFALAATFASAAAWLLSSLDRGSLVQQVHETGSWGMAAEVLAFGGFLTALLALVIYWLGQRPRLRVAAPALAGCFALFALANEVPKMWADQFRIASPKAMGTWKSTVPADSEVFWPENPVACWALLERRSFVSSLQTSGILFSANAFSEIKQRLEDVSAILPSTFALRAATEGALWTPSSQTVIQSCQSATLDFLVTGTAMDLPEAAPAIEFEDERSGKVYQAHLYRCAAFRPEED